ncbi:MAG: 3D domain-containing protein [Bacillota bacterium]
MAGFDVSEPLQVKATAYDACIKCTGKTDGITRTGTRAQSQHTIAVDPNLIPLGAQVFIPSLGGIFTAEDTGGAIKGNRVDVYMNNHEDALQFGVQELVLYVLEKVKTI